MGKELRYLSWLPQFARPPLVLWAIASIATFGLAQTAYAWQTTIWSFAHTNQYGGSANSGTRTGSVEYSGMERRVRVGAQNIAYTPAQQAWMVNWQTQNGLTTNAFVFHVNPKNTSGDVCTNIRTVSGWNWTSLPNASVTSKGCGIGSGYNGNEIRFYFNPNNLNTSLTYYAQSLYKDTGYNSTNSSKALGEMNYDSYATNVFGVRVHNDYHGKICINLDITYPPSASGC